MKPPKPKKARRRADEGQLPVDPVRLRKEFPEITDEEMAAFVEVTRLLMSAPERGGVLRQTMQMGREAQGRIVAGEPISADERRAMLYLMAIGKMQRPSGDPRGH